jgi:hypothetical protein
MMGSFSIPIAIAEYNLQKNISGVYKHDSSKELKISPICSKIDSIETLKKKLHEDVKHALQYNNEILQAKKQEIVRVSASIDSVSIGGDMEIPHIDTINTVMK